MRAVICLLLFCSLLLTGCSDLNISNPFEQSTTSGNEVYFDQFPDVPIPRDMSVDSKRSLIPVAQDGTKTGLLTVEGRVDKPSLVNAMFSNMNRQGWTLRGATMGDKAMHLYEKDNRFAVLYFYEQTTTTAMEIWVLTRLADGVLPTMSSGETPIDMNQGSAPSYYLTPTDNNPAPSQGVTQQGLSQ